MYKEEDIETKTRWNRCETALKRYGKEKSK